MAPFYIDFCRFWHRFRQLWNLQVGAKLAKNTSHNLPQPVWKPIGDDRKVWKGFGNGFGWIWNGFGAVLGAFGEGSGRICTKDYARFWGRLSYFWALACTRPAQTKLLGWRDHHTVSLAVLPCGANFFLLIAVWKQCPQPNASSHR